ncbi:MAG: hypothetical protein M5R40_29215 [Anaerolineae bacterium]|nr:hypothetical protein [Anaerolineae bacterium]
MLLRGRLPILTTAALLALAAACQPAPTPTPTLPPALPGEVNLVIGCDPRDVDNWTEAMGYLSEAFGELIVQADAADAGALPPIIEEMRIYKTSIDALVVPAECAQETHRLVALMVADVINAFEARLNDPDFDVRPVVTRAQGTLQLARSRIEVLTSQMEATLEARNQ